MSTSPAILANIQKKVWAGSLPLEIRLASADCRTIDEIDPYLVYLPLFYFLSFRFILDSNVNIITHTVSNILQISLPRLSYLFTLLPRLHNFFSAHLINPSTPSHTAWLSFENVALKYHYPIGLLYDLFSGATPANPDDDDEVEAAEALPWKLVVSYSKFPVEWLMGLDKEGKVVRDCYVNAVKEVSFLCIFLPCLLWWWRIGMGDESRMYIGLTQKQADVIRNGKGNVYMGLSKYDSDTLWQAVQDRKSFPISRYEIKEE
jgi:autophagy-related protein 5